MIESERESVCLHHFFCFLQKDGRFSIRCPNFDDVFNPAVVASNVNDIISCVANKIDCHTFICIQ